MSSARGDKWEAGQFTFTATGSFYICFHIISLSIISCFHYPSAGTVQSVRAGQSDNRDSIPGEVKYVLTNLGPSNLLPNDHRDRGHFPGIKW